MSVNPRSSFCLGKVTPLDAGHHPPEGWRRSRAPMNAGGTARWWAWKDSNLRLAGYEPAVLTI